MADFYIWLSVTIVFGLLCFFPNIQILRRIFEDLGIWEEYRLAPWFRILFLF